MPYYLAEIRVNRSNNSEKRKQKTIRHILAALALIAVLFSVQLMMCSTTVVATEPPLTHILNDIGFTNITLIETETFPAGRYNITLYAEIASYCNQNVLSYYPVNTSNYHTIFEGLEGGDNAYVVPPLTKTFQSDTQFGLSMLAPGPHRYFTEHELNPDYPEQHAQVYVNLDNPDMFLIGFENKFGGGDRDYNDMVFSLVPISYVEVGNVTAFPETPNYNQSVTITAEIVNGSTEIESVILSYQVNNGSWANVTMSQDNGFYVAEIPPQPYNTEVNYKIYVIHTDGSFVSELFTYTVCDFVPPVISDVNHVPSVPEPSDNVEISANVTEPPEASGVKNVTVWYTIEGGWTFTGMTETDGGWKAIIPGQDEGVDVEFFIEAFDKAGNKATTETSNYTVIVPNSPPVASLVYAPSIVYTDENVDFDASTSYDPDGYIISYTWDFGDGTNATGAIVSHTYLENGEYAVTITVVDNEGAVSSKFAVQVVKNRSPIAEIEESASEVEKEEVVTYDASLSYDPDGTIVNYQWDFGDGNTATGITVNHSYEQDGTYLVTLTVTDNDGTKDSDNVITVVTNKKPVASFTVTPEAIEIGETVTFDASESYDPDGTIVSYQWNFGDGNTATGVEVSHSYMQYGVYTVKLTVTDDSGATDTVTVTKIVGNMQSPLAVLTKSAETVNLDEEITFSADESDDPDGTIVNYQWDFGDGNTATGITVNHSYEQDGTYLVTLTVTDNDGLTDSTYTIVVVVLNSGPVASFTVTPEIVETGENVTFDASESYDPDGTIVSYQWNFGDGNTATGTTANHVYSKDGTYMVTLTVTDNSEASVSVYAVAVVTNRGPVAAFSSTPETVETDGTITFNASESYDPDGTIVSYQWNFGDGNTATGTTANHAYSEAGNYTVTLTVIDDNGAVASTSFDQEVGMPPTAVPLAILSVIALGIAALTATLIYGLMIRRKKKKK